MCMGTLVFGALLLAGCSWGAVSAVETRAGGWRAVGLVMCACGGVLGGTTVFGAFHGHDGDGRVAVVGAPVVVVIEVEGRAAG